MTTSQTVNRVQKSATRCSSKILQLAILWLATGMGSIAHAYLGGDISSIGTDQKIMRAEKMAKKTPSPSGDYTVHEITLPSGTLVREYASSTGVVFAVTWKGPFIPNLQQILGDHFQTLEAQQKRQSRVGNRYISHHAAGLVIESSGHPRAFVGRAYLPISIPAGVTPEEIQ